MLLIILFVCFLNYKETVITVPSVRRRLVIKHFILLNSHPLHKFNRRPGK